MKIFSRKRRRFWEVGFLLLFASSMLALPSGRQHFYYPSSDMFINPANGKPDPEFAKFLTPLISQTDDVVFINVGDVPSDVIKMAALQYLSPVIRMHPKASIFRMNWNIHVSNYFADVELDYNRKEGEIAVTETETLPGRSRNAHLLGKYLTDRDIHQAAQSNIDYEVWAEKHWRE